jgi:tRNA(Ile2) C34 agmatinyltransferase TiaS
MWSAHLGRCHIINIDRLHFHRFQHTPREQRCHRSMESKDERIYYQCNNSFPSFAIQFLAALAPH